MYSRYPAQSLAIAIPSRCVSAPPRGLPNRWIGNKESEPLGQVNGISLHKREPGPFDHLSIFRDIAGQQAKSGAHGIKQCQQQALHIGWQHENHCIGEQFIECFARHPVQNPDSIAGMLAEFAPVVVTVT